MRYLLAILPILVVLALMIRLRWGAHQAGAAGLAIGVLVATVAFGLTPHVFWVSEAKGFLLSAFVLGVMWPALLLYHWIDQNQGIRTTAKLLEQAIPDPGMCLLLLAWSLSGLLEGIAGFGLPIAVVAPMLVALGVPALRAVAAVAVGHAWAATFGDMGVILQTLSVVVAVPVPELVPYAAILLGFTCLICGLLAAAILRQIRHWVKIIWISMIMGSVQYALAANGLVPLSAFAAGLSGLLGYLLGSRFLRKASFRWGSIRLSDGTLSAENQGRPAVAEASTHRLNPPRPRSRPPPRNRGEWIEDEGENEDEEERKPPGPGSQCMRESESRLPIITFACYGALTLLMAGLSMSSPLQRQLHGIAWMPRFESVITSTGFVTPAGAGQVFRPFVHPGTLILLVAAASIALGSLSPGGRLSARRAALATFNSAAIPSIGILLMVGLSTLMDHCGMSFLLAQGLSSCLGKAYPLVSPLVGILGAFATGSNNNSNVLFGSLQKNVAILLQVQPALLLAAQTAGGSLGSMLAPAKIIVGCSTVSEVGREGAVLRQTVPLGLGAGLVVGLLTLILCLLAGVSQ